MKENTVAVVRPQDIPVPAEALAAVKIEVAQRFSICPVGISEARGGMRTLTIAMSDPSNLMLLDQLQQMTGCRISAVQASAQDIARGIDIHYSGNYTDAPTDLLQAAGAAPPVVQAEREQAVNSMVEQRGASGLVENILEKAMRERATDIHIEPHQKTVFVRFRVDGVMYDQFTYEPPQHAQVISRIKILSKLDIAQNRLPQDGRFDVAFGAKEFDVRVSTVPATGGEKAVLRMLPKGPVAMDLNQLGLSERNRATLEELVSKPFGMVLATGPTGSGKTTTLYACLAKIDCTGKNVITVEDPVEYQLPRITQIQVHPKIGLTFAAGLRAILRQDPDIILVGEIRDLETLEIAVQSALTGHLVLSTLHCNDAAAGAARMVDMGAEPFLISSSMAGVSAQRLVRRLCEKCKQPQSVSSEIRAKLSIKDDCITNYAGTGCGACRGTGFKGRVSDYEIVPFIEPIQQAVIRKATASEIRGIIKECGIPSLKDDGMEKARQGITSLEEILRAVSVEAI